MKQKKFRPDEFTMVTMIAAFMQSWLTRIHVTFREDLMDYYAPGQDSLHVPSSVSLYFDPRDYIRCSKVGATTIHMDKASRETIRDFDMVKVNCQAARFYLLINSHFYYSENFVDSHTLNIPGLSRRELFTIELVEQIFLAYARGVRQLSFLQDKIHEEVDWDYEHYRELISEFFRKLIKDDVIKVAEILRFWSLVDYLEHICLCECTEFHNTAVFDKKLMKIIEHGNVLRVCERLLNEQILVKC